MFQPLFIAVFCMRRFVTCGNYFGFILFFESFLEIYSRPTSAIAAVILSCRVSPLRLRNVHVEFSNYHEIGPAREIYHVPCDLLNGVGVV